MAYTSDGKLNPRDFEEFADGNAMQREMFFWSAERVIKKSYDLCFLNKCLRLMVEADHENRMLGQAIAFAANKRLMRINYFRGLPGAIKRAVRWKLRAVLARRRPNSASAGSGTLQWREDNHQS